MLKTMAVIVVLAGIAAGLWLWWPWGRGPEALKLPGTVEIHEVRLGPRVAGRVRRVLVGEGDVVPAGKALVELEMPEVEARRDMLKARLEAATAERYKAEQGPRRQEKLAAAEAARSAKARWEKLRKGYREEEKRQAAGERDAAEADFRNAQEEHERAAKLARANASARAELEAARAQLDRTKGRLARARAASEMMEAGSRPEDIAEAEAEFKRLEQVREMAEEGTRREDIDAARAREAEARAALAEAEANLREATVRSAEPCVVELVGVRPGDLVAAGQPVVRALRTGDLWVKTYVPETELGKLRLGQEVGVAMDSYPGKELAGRIVHIGAESEFTPRNVQTVDERRHQMFGIRVKVDDPKGHFKSGMAAQVTILVP
ncbi:MAG: efflux RND transporter periplasmic adaptor subunit [Gemmataceae bacterium]|nr:efflux RND transporter periplasmic adaptor subunit [Gemmataceae bacterium]